MSFFLNFFVKQMAVNISHVVVQVVKEQINVELLSIEPVDDLPTFIIIQ